MSEKNVKDLGFRQEPCIQATVLTAKQEQLRGL